MKVLKLMFLEETIYENVFFEGVVLKIHFLREKCWKMYFLIINFQNEQRSGIKTLGARAPTIISIIFWHFLMFYQIFFSPQVNDERLLLIKMAYMSCLTSCQTT